ncbi:MAG TPA: ribosome small subunit-dependent GTPase A [Gaiellaceae bacterium]|nr:ribosome small subunit-dependent GTPase A [Gaiellaceae bacterium]
MQFPNLERLGWHAELAQQFEVVAPGLQPGRVTAQHRGAWQVATEGDESLAEITGRLRHEADPGDLPVVGDWIGLRDGLIDAVLPRRSKFSRKTPWTEVSEQVLVANVDVAFLVMGLDERDFNVRRLERYLTTAWEGGADPVIVLNKADLAYDLDAQLAETELVAFGVPVHPVSAETGGRVEELRRYLAGNRTVVLLGSSGVGKSSLINRLLREERFRTADVRGDGRGRHTTTHRELVPVPDGGVIIDTPGLRELQLWDADDGLEQAFVDVADLVAQCRFSDCQHQTEPGCAIKAALAEGSLPADRWASYQKLQRELARLERKLDPKLRSEQRKQWAAITKSHRHRRKVIGH